MGANELAWAGASGIIAMTWTATSEAGKIIAKSMPQCAVAINVTGAVFTIVNGVLIDAAVTYNGRSSDDETLHAVGEAIFSASWNLLLSTGGPYFLGAVGAAAAVGGAYAVAGSGLGAFFATHSTSKDVQLYDMVWDYYQNIGAKAFDLKEFVWDGLNKLVENCSIDASEVMFVENPPIPTVCTNSCPTAPGSYTYVIEPDGKVNLRLTSWRGIREDGGVASGSWGAPISINLTTWTNLFSSAQTARYLDPLILDLDNDGLETTSLSSGAYFDHDSNGFAEQTGWASVDDGLLVMDRNTDGIINNGTELFGDQTILQNGQRATDGFQALSELDSNTDGIADVNDTAFSNLRIWQDIYGDGYNTPDELFTLEEMGIQSINLTHTDTNIVDPQGNTQIQSGIFTKTDGTTASLGGFNLQRDITYTIANDWLDIPDDIASLPDLQGYGNTCDLHQALVRDTTGTLKSLIEQFITAEDITIRESFMEQILFNWTGSDTINPDSRGPNFDARKLVVLEKLMGQSFTGARLYIKLPKSVRGGLLYDNKTYL